ncbi:hypothetical protein CAMRE0001_3133 [Campylobacter rectus RM3267]|jgi:hypothetical protein|uniref:Lipoprotein n=1 Tax=Campylobacter rectus RM3267 TaxID=553218 RepID=B9D148_CAMRE|nr:MULTISPECIES: hypothetical protein [Campylobacter]EEF14248.1 hypothetical protein CAMRE0001_3133 [Campylobacter rectus RM3267]
MKKIAIIMAVAILAAFLSGCADKPSKIERISPCACYDFIKVG